MPAFLVFLFVVFAGIQLNGQLSETYRYRELTVSHGLPDPSVSRINQDKNGYIWLATLNGIARYNGNSIRKYHPSREMNPNATNRDFPYLHLSDSGSLWVGYLRDNHALFRYDVPRDSFLYFDPFVGTVYSDSLVSVRAVLEDREKNLWVATSLKGLFKIDLSDHSEDTLKYRYYRADASNNSSLPTNFMAPGLWQDPSGRIWVLTEAGLVEYRAATDDFISYQWSEIPQENEGMMLAPDTLRNCFWIGTFNGLIRFDLLTKRTKLFQFAEELTDTEYSNFTPVITLDRSGQLWVVRGAFPYSTLWTFDPDQESFRQAFADGLNVHSQFPGSLHLFTDLSGNVWSGNFQRGVQAINPNVGNVRRVKLPSTSNPRVHFDESGVLAMAEYSPGNFFVGTKAQGVWRWDQQQATLSRVEIRGLNPDVDSVGVNALVLAEELDLMWVITSKAIYEYSLTTKKSNLLKVLDGMEGAKKYRNACYRDGWLWGGSLGQGAFRLAVGETEGMDYFSFNTADSLEGHLPFGGINDIQPGIEPGQFWLISVYGGLLEWLPEAKRFREHPTQRDLRHLLLSTSGLLWLASPGSVKLYDPQTQKHLSLPSQTSEALADPLSIASCLDGRIWVATNSGIVVVDEKERSVLHHFSASTWLNEQYRWNEGLINCLVASDGKAYFATETGVFVVDPNEISYDTKPPLVALQSFAVNGRKRLLPLQPTAEVTLGYEGNNLNFTVAVLHFSSPRDNRLNYLLKGSDTEWLTAVPETDLAYYGLAPGKYRLLVRGVNGDGTKGAVQELINIHIKVPWYSTSLAFLLYLIFFLTIGYVWFLAISSRKGREFIAPNQPAVREEQEHTFILMARKIVVKNLAEQAFGPDQMAAALSISRSQLHRRLDKLAGVSTTHFINAIRLAEARKKLSDHTFTIAEIAYDCGYSDPSYFSRKFREFYGMNPTKFREKR